MYFDASFSSSFYTAHNIFTTVRLFLFRSRSTFICLNKSDSTINVRQALAVYSALSTSSVSVDSFLSLSSNFLMVQAREGWGRCCLCENLTTFIKWTFPLHLRKRARQKIGREETMLYDGERKKKKSLALHLNVIYIQHIPAYSLLLPSMCYQT